MPPTKRARWGRLGGVAPGFLDIGPAGGAVAVLAGHGAQRGELANWDAAYGSRREQILSATAGTSGGLTPRGFLGAEHLAHHIHEAPVWVFAVLRGAADATSPRAGSSIYGAVQQLCLAARAYGIGTSLTTLYGGHEEELRELLGLPPDALAMALVPMGYPAKGRWAEPRRRPVEEVVHWDRWDAKRPRPER
jgi:nitroreductase